jgi:hypothetical protein
MGWRKPKLAPVEATKLTRFATGDVMDVIETSLMGAQVAYDALRRAGSEERGYHLHVLQVALQQGLTGTEELQHREGEL